MPKILRTISMDEWCITQHGKARHPLHSALTCQLPKLNRSLVSRKLVWLRPTQENMSRKLFWSISRNGCQKKELRFWPEILSMQIVRSWWRRCLMSSTGFIIGDCYLLTHAHIILMSVAGSLVSGVTSLITSTTADASLRRRIVNKSKIPLWSR